VGPVCMNRRERRAAGERTTGRIAARVSPSSTTSSGQLFAVALQHHQGGKLAEAESLYRRILTVDPNHADSLHSLGVIAYQAGRNDVAVDIIGQAIALSDRVPGFHNNLGNALQAQGRLAEATECYRRAVILDQTFAVAHYNLGNVLKEQAKLTDAAESYRRALAIKPDYAEAQNNLGGALQAQGEFAEAAESYRRALAMKPDYAEAQNNLGSALQAQGEFAEAAESYRRALAIKPDYAEAENNLGNTLQEQGKLAEAVDRYERALALKPHCAETHNNLGNAFRAQGKLTEAVAAYENASALGHVLARHMAAALNGETTKQPPPEYVVKIFDPYAARFEAHLVGTLAYRVPETLRRMMDETNFGRRFERTVDLGCGTGLMGVTFRGLTDRLVGVDVAPKMIEQSAEKKIYNRLELAEIVAFLEGERNVFDLFLAGDVLVYLGALDALFTAIASRGHPGALLAFSAEISSGPDYELTSSGRYAHSRSYLMALLAQVGGRVLACETHPMRLQDGQLVHGSHIIAVLGI
jgi:predicted TPR repeat methyltransferase